MFGCSAKAKHELKPAMPQKFSGTNAKVQLQEEFLTISQPKVLSTGGSLKEKHMEARLD